MKESDPLNPILREWKAPDPSPELDARVRAAYRAAYPPLWRRMLSLRVTIPVPVLAAVLLVVVGMMFRSRETLPTTRPAPTPASMPLPTSAYATRIETTGFQPLPDGAVRIIRSGGPRK